MKNYNRLKQNDKTISYLSSLPLQLNVIFLQKLIRRILVLYYSNLINGLSHISPKSSVKIAASIFSRPRSKKLLGHQRDYLFERKAGTFKFKNKAVQYYNWQNSNSDHSLKILLIHGWESNSYRWKSYIDAFLKLGLKVYAMDAPAHGLSEGKFFNPLEYPALIDQLVQKEKINIILGHSAGAYSTIIYAHEFDCPSHLTDLILLAPTGKLRKFLSRFFDFLSINNVVRQEFERHFEAIRENDVDYYDSDNLIKAVSLKGILIHDEDDETLPFCDSVEIGNNWKNGKFIPTKGFGHRLKGDKVKNIIIGYLTHLKE